MCRGGVEDGGGLGHFHHEGGTPARHVVAGADAGIDAVHNAQPHALGGNKTAHLRHDDQQRRLTQISGLATHVGPGDKQQAGASGFDVEVVGDEFGLAGRLQQALHDRMAGAYRLQHGRLRSRLSNLGAHVTAQRGQVSEVRQQIDLGNHSTGKANTSRGLQDGLTQFAKDALFNFNRPLMRGQDADLVSASAPGW